MSLRAADSALPEGDANHLNKAIDIELKSSAVVYFWRTFGFPKS